MSPSKMMKLLMLSGWLLLVVASCADRHEPLPEDAVILAFGDSLTEGVGVTKGQDYPSQLAQITGLKVINAGISGETTSQGVKRFAAELDRSAPDLVILLEGGNDILRNHALEKTRQNLAAMIQMAQSRQIPVLLLGVPEKKLFSNHAPLYSELAAEYPVIFEGQIISQLLRDNQYKSDSVHFNPSGYRKLAERIHHVLTESGLLPPQ